ncbi:ubiquitin carboxyl-terminal hydrolase 43-like [Amphiura filiformis]|uniref:ubiquitin carboxyl-terminal hydrolase 43-like n=1 Tax=Amphiura filiformis TaxID=82378 RepID=UPI003B21A1E4
MERRRMNVRSASEIAMQVARKSHFQRNHTTTVYEHSSSAYPYCYRGDTSLPRGSKLSTEITGLFDEEQFWQNRTLSLPRHVANGVTRSISEHFTGDRLRAIRPITSSSGSLASRSINGTPQRAYTESISSEQLGTESPMLKPAFDSSMHSQPSVSSFGSVLTNSASPHHHHQKKKSRKPSFRAFGHLVQKMMRQIRSMDDSRSSYTDDSGSSVYANDEAEGHVYRTSSPPLSPLRLNCRVPGISGLRNHGNTCFMNAIIQCLSNTDMLAEYFVLEQYKQDLHRGKKNNKKFGTKGEVTEQLACLMKAIWECRYSPSHTTEFKKVVAKYGSQYRGNDQHDAQEFLLWLLDKVHEDLNCASKKKYKQVKNSHNKTDELLAAEMLANHMRCNNSFVHDLFQAQYRSSLTCPNCGRQSNTFDPFLCVSLPIPQRTTRVLTVVVVYMERDPRVVRVGLALETSGTVADLRSEVATECGVAITRIVLTEVYFDGFYRSFQDSMPLSDIRDGDSIYAIETPYNSQSIGNANSRELAQYIHVHCSKHAREVVTLVIINQLGLGRAGRRFGQPLAFEVDRSVTHQQLKIVLLKAMGCSHVDQVLSRGPILRIGIVADTKGTRSYLLQEDTRPLYNGSVSRMLQTSRTGGGPPHIKAIVEWEHDIRFTFTQRVLSIYIEEDESVARERLAHQQPIRASLPDCIDLYTQEERLGPDNAWHCPFCKRLQQGTKKLSLWSLPDILIIHLKRFKQVGNTRTKLNTLVEFPLNNLNMEQYIERRQPSPQAATLASLTGWSPWRQNHRRRSNNAVDCMYDLYAVCNHMGSLNGGHYTAFCKNPTDSLWYDFDDAKVTPFCEDAVISKSAYILFYHRRNNPNGSSSSSSSTSSSTSDHWVYRIPSMKNGLNGLNGINHYGSPDDSPVLQQNGFHFPNGSLTMTKY